MKGKLIYVIGILVITISAVGIGFYFLNDEYENDKETTQTEREETGEKEKEYTEIGSMPKDVSRNLREAFEGEYDRVEVRAVSMGDMGGWYVVGVETDDDGYPYYTKIRTVKEDILEGIDRLEKDDIPYEIAHVLITMESSYEDERAKPREIEYSLYTWVYRQFPNVPNEWVLHQGPLVAPSDHPAMRDNQVIN